MKLTRYEQVREHMRKTSGKDWMIDHRISLGDDILRMGYEFGMQGYINVEDD